VNQYPDASTDAVLFFDSCAIQFDDCDRQLNCLTRKEIFCIHRLKFKAIALYPKKFAYLLGKKDDEVVIIFVRFIHKLVKVKPIISRNALTGKLNFLIVTNDNKFFDVAKRRYNQRRHKKLDLVFVGGKKDGYILSQGMKFHIVNLRQKSETGYIIENKRNLVDKISVRWGQLQKLRGHL